MKAFHSDHPKTDATCSPSRQASPSAANISDPAETLLVVGDDPVFRELEVQVLCDLGYKVLKAGSSAEGLQLAGVTATIHLLLTDFWMSEADALEFTRRFRTAHPSTPALLVSNSVPVMQNEAGDLDQLAILEKPFTSDELIYKVRMLLDKVAPLPMRTAKKKSRKPV
jgi:CheY-like chemotaxis protein